MKVTVVAIPSLLIFRSSSVLTMSASCNFSLDRSIMASSMEPVEACSIHAHTMCTHSTEHSTEHSTDHRAQGSHHAHTAQSTQESRRDNN
jgi:hypothetical protein